MTTTPGLHSLHNWYCQPIWVNLGEMDHPADDTALEIHGVEAQYHAEKSVMQAIWTEVKEADQDAAEKMIQDTKPWMIGRWSESKLEIRKPLVWLLKDNVYLVDLEQTEEEQAKLKTLVEWYTSQHASEGWWVQWWHLQSLF